MLDLRQIANALGGDISNGQITAPGPGHKSKSDRSLSIRLDASAPDGFLCHSFAGDDPIRCRDYIRQKCGLPAFKPNGQRRRKTSAEIENLLAAAIDHERKPTATLFAKYRYTDRDGTLLYEVLKYINPKRFVQRRPDPDRKGAWIWSLRDQRRVLYRWPNLIEQSGTVFICEGEKDADRVIEQLKYPATTVASGKWTPDCAEALRDRDCWILADNDSAGEKKALDAAKNLHGVAASIKIIRLPGLAEGGDISDWLDAEHTTEEFEDVCYHTPDWTQTPGEENNASEIVPVASKAIVEAGPAPSISPTISPTISPPLPFIDIAAWHDQPVPDREWCVLNRIPMRNVTLFSGEGAIGKSIVSLQLSVAHVLGKDWLGSMPEPGPALIVACEDDPDELHRRLARILEHYGASFADLKNMHLISLAGQDALLARPNSLGLIQPTKLFDRLRDAARKIHPKLVVLDNSADVFGGSENDRAQVRQFVGILRGLAIAANAGVLLTSHPSLTGISTGSGISGSTAWHASVRSRLYMKRATTERDEEPDPSLRVIEIMKSNYGPVGETIMVRWQNGLFLPEAKPGSLEKLAADQAADDLFMKLLDKFTAQGRNVSHARTANNYAPTAFAVDPDGKGKHKALAAAMEQLFAAGKIKVETYGRKSKAAGRVVRVERP
jgi:RecA-family ATPase